VRCGEGQAEAGVQSGADRSPATGNLPRPPLVVGVPRDDLPGALPGRKGRIDHRPPIVEQRSRVGDRDGDLITGRRNQSAIGTRVERASRYVKLVPLPAGHSAADLRASI
jgi:hypothetical protein